MFAIANDVNERFSSFPSFRVIVQLIPHSDKISVRCAEFPSAAWLWPNAGMFSARNPAVNVQLQVRLSHPLTNGTHTDYASRQAYVYISVGDVRTLFAVCSNQTDTESHIII
jgi:hypothetical protein